MVGLFGLAVKLWIDNKKLTIDSETGIRDHYAKELAALRAQRLADNVASDARIAAAELRYTEAVDAADKRHHLCEEECDRLRERVAGMERKFQQLHETTLRLFQPREDLPEAMKVHIRSLEQLIVPTGRASYGGDVD
jgi:hypothetical protein